MSKPDKPDLLQATDPSKTVNVAELAIYCTPVMELVSDDPPGKPVPKLAPPLPASPPPASVAPTTAQCGVFWSRPVTRRS